MPRYGIIGSKQQAAVDNRHMNTAEGPTHLLHVRTGAAEAERAPVHLLQGGCGAAAEVTALLSEEDIRWQQLAR
jgi:hypothetical protein